MTKEQLREKLKHLTYQVNEGSDIDGKFSKKSILVVEFNEAVHFFWSEIEMTKQLTISDQKTKERYIEHLEAEIFKLKQKENLSELMKTDQEHGMYEEQKVRCKCPCHTSNYKHIVPCCDNGFIMVPRIKRNKI